jgi:hypothetical protein
MSITEKGKLCSYHFLPPMSHIFLKLHFNVLKIPIHLPFQGNITLEKMSSLFLGKSLRFSRIHLGVV